ncbi:PDZ domain-containing protein [bacterium]|nr:PDZ domain-containing protein [bacterium]
MKKLTLVFVFLITIVSFLFLVSIISQNTLAEECIIKTKSEGGYLGVYIDDLCDELRESLDYEGDGAFIDDVVDDSPADEAGIEAGDIVIKFDKKKVKDASDLRRFVRETKPGKKVKIELIREGKEKTLTAKIDETEDVDWSKFSFSLGSEKFKTPLKKMIIHPPGMKCFIHCDSDEDRGFLGVHIQDLSGQLAEYFGVKEGVLVTEVIKDTPADKIGMKAGDVIIEFRNREVENCDDLRYLVRKTKLDQEVEIKVMRDRQVMTFTTKLEEKSEKFGFKTKEAEEMYLQGLKIKEIEEIECLDEKLEDLIEKNIKIKIKNEQLEDVMEDLEIRLRPELPD